MIPHNISCIKIKLESVKLKFGAWLDGGKTCVVGEVLLLVMKKDDEACCVQGSVGGARVDGAEDEGGWIQTVECRGKLVQFKCCGQMRWRAV